MSPTMKCRAVSLEKLKEEITAFERWVGEETLRVPDLKGPVMEDCADAARQAVKSASGSPSNPAASESPSDAEDDRPI